MFSSYSQGWPPQPCLVMTILIGDCSLIHFWELRLIKKGTTMLIPLCPGPQELGSIAFAVCPQRSKSLEKKAASTQTLWSLSQDHILDTLHLQCWVGSFLVGLSSCRKNIPWCVHPDLKGWPRLFVGRVYTHRHVGWSQMCTQDHLRCWSRGAGQWPWAKEFRGALPQPPCSTRNVEESQSPNFRLPRLPGH